MKQGKYIFHNVQSINFSKNSRKRYIKLNDINFDLSLWSFCDPKDRVLTEVISKETCYYYLDFTVYKTHTSCSQTFVFMIWFFSSWKIDVVFIWVYREKIIITFVTGILFLVVLKPLWTVIKLSETAFAYVATKRFPGPAAAVENVFLNCMWYSQQSKFVDLFYYLDQFPNPQFLPTHVLISSKIDICLSK